MSNNEEIILPAKPRIVLEEGNKGVYEIDGLSAGYGNTLGNSLRRIILSSLPGAAITTAKISGVNHEFSTIKGIKEDVITILLNLKQIRFKFFGKGLYKASLSVMGQREVKASDFKTPTQIEILNKDHVIARLADKNSKLDIEITIEKGTGYVPKELLRKEKVETGILMLDAIFTPIRRVNYEVENMRVGERTDYNRLRFLIETDGSITPREALENSIKTLIRQLSAIIGFSEKENEKLIKKVKTEQKESEEKKHKKIEEERAEKETQKITKEVDEEELKEDFLKTRVEDLTLSNRTLNALSKVGIRTVGGLVRKKGEDLLEIEGLGDKAINEIRRALGNFGLILK
ncbi:DNA-directed RNA polymerase subunit alpha [Patescibacteria group bacterium]